MMIVTKIARFLKRTFERCRVTTYYGVSIIPTLPKSAIFYCIQLIYLNRPNSIRKDQYILDFISLALIIAYKNELRWQYLTKGALI